MEYKYTIPTNIVEGVWDEKSCIRRTSGFSLDATNLPSSMGWLPKGAPLALNSTKTKAVLVKTAKVYEDATSSASVKVYKNHALIVGDVIGGQAVSAIDAANANYDVLTMAAAITASSGEVLSESNGSSVIGLNYATVKIDSYPSVTPTLQAYEIEEDSLPYAINDAIKTALTVRHAFKF